ncbi:alpha-methylacyl-CoA racemase [Variovorax paradoxus]|uniref:Alpha-methylacyl-CoA racemase n=1 Tax=Variovorax paradoxus TaxID=34073 RepID=A0AAE4C120_VARPD|nr:CaiB/BaiF CoA-transferase family protein [Variovorax paradoxus]MDP9968184.1 alpha-methylacyl-CoA racemase [Variovorax paradoxus]MDR6429739.1 alpha-methylacyl-CoA racemase [Variovorax paradoxus]
MNSTGPLHGYRIVEFAGKGPGPLCGMLLGDMGAEVIRIERPVERGASQASEDALDLVNRNRRSVVLDLWQPQARTAALRIAASADGLIEGFRPGVMERLGLGPDECLSANPRLVYGRVTGWGQTGPLAARAGHDINYLGLTGALHAIGPPDGAPVPPLNLVADYGGGAMYLAFGLVCGLLEAKQSGMGQVIDVAMTDAVSNLMTPIHGLHGAGWWKDRRGANLLDGGAPFYGVHETRDGGYMAVGPIEPAFFAAFIRRLGLSEDEFADRMNPANWPSHALPIRAAFRQKTRAEWEEVFAGSDACVTPVLSLSEAPSHPHNRARGTFAELDGLVQPAVAPRFSRTPGTLRSAPPEHGADGRAVLEEVGYAPEEIDRILQPV